MKLTVYKGFDSVFLESLTETMLVQTKISAKRDVLSFDRKTRKQLDSALIIMEEEDEAWVTYEEYSLIKTRVDEAIEEDGLHVVIFRNNLYPDYYPIPFELSVELATETMKVLKGDTITDVSEECQRLTAIYNAIVLVDGKYYGSFYNYEYDKDDRIHLQDYYPSRITIEDGQVQSDYNVFLNDDIETYLRDLVNIMDAKPFVIGVKSSEGFAAQIPV